MMTPPLRREAMGRPFRLRPQRAPVDASSDTAEGHQSSHLAVPGRAARPARLLVTVEQLLSARTAMWSSTVVEKAPCSKKRRVRRVAGGTRRLRPTKTVGVSAHRQPATLEMFGPPAAFHLRPCPRPGAGTVCRALAFEDDALHALALGPRQAARRGTRPEYGGTMPKSVRGPVLGASSRRAEIRWPIVGSSSSRELVESHERDANVLRCRLAHAEATGETVEVAQSPSPDHELAVEDIVVPRLGEAVELGNRSREARPRRLRTRTRPSLTVTNGAPAVKFRLNPPSLERTRRTPGDSKHRLVVATGHCPSMPPARRRYFLRSPLSPKPGFDAVFAFLRRSAPRLRPTMTCSEVNLPFSSRRTYRALLPEPIFSRAGTGFPFRRL